MYFLKEIHLLCRYTKMLSSHSVSKFCEVIFSFEIVLCCTDPMLADCLKEQATGIHSKYNQTTLSCSVFKGLIFCAVYWTMEKLQPCLLETFPCPVFGEGGGGERDVCVGWVGWGLILVTTREDHRTWDSLERYHSRIIFFKPKDVKYRCIQTTWLMHKTNSNT